MGVNYRGGVAFNPDGSPVDGASSQRSAVVTQAAVPVINADTTNQAVITGLAQAITGVTVTGTPTEGQRLTVSITDNGTARAIAWGSQFEASGTVALPTTTVLGVRLDTEFIYNSATAKWRCILKA